MMYYNCVAYNALLGVSLMIQDNVCTADDLTFAIECFNKCTNEVIPPSNPIYCLLEVSEASCRNASHDAVSTSSSYTRSCDIRSRDITSCDIISCDIISCDKCMYN